MNKLNAYLLNVGLICLMLNSPAYAEKKVEKPKAAKEAVAKEAAPKQAPEKFSLIMETTKGTIEFSCDRSQAPIGLDRLHQLVKEGFFKDLAFFRVLDGFVAQFGIHGDPKVSTKWRDSKIADDPVKGSNKAGTLTFATAGKDTRTTQFFINLVDNPRLDGMGFSPICKIEKGMDAVKKLHSGYGEGAPMGSGPAQDLLQMEGNAYLKKSFPKLDYIKSASIK
jgi:peptidyl-prolyl cis-trans isomerase A (cyclophilin A)